MLDGKIVLVDDNEAVLKTLKMILAREFKTVVGVSVPTLLPALLREGDVDIVLLDMNFVTGRQDGSEGLFWLERIVDCPDSPQVVLITAFGDIELAVSALKRGAADFVVKPWDNEKLIATLQGAFRRRRKERAEAAGIGDDKSLAQLLHYLQFQEVATRNFQAYMNEMEAWCKNISNTVESRIKEAEKVVE